MAGAENKSDWKSFIKNHWKVFSVFVAAATALFVGAIYVFVWFAGNAPATGLVPSSLGLWSMSSIVWFILYLLLWEVALIGIPAAIAGVAAWQWWKRLSEAEKSGIHSGRGGRGSRAGGVVSPLLFIAFAIKVYVDGNWNQAVSSYTLDYVVGSMVTILLWIVAIFAVPAIIGVVWWLSGGRKKQPQTLQN